VLSLSLRIVGFTISIGMGHLSLCHSPRDSP
jgi:hypothetical protein